MPDYPSRLVRDRFTGKLGAEERTGKHLFYDFYDADGTYLAQTHISHGAGSIPIGLISTMARQLGVNTGQLRGAIDCTVSAVDFLALMRNSP